MKICTFRSYDWRKHGVSCRISR